MCFPKAVVHYDQQRPPWRDAKLIHMQIAAGLSFVTFWLVPFFHHVSASWSAATCLVLHAGVRVSVHAAVSSWASYDAFTVGHTTSRRYEDCS